VEINNNNILVEGHGHNVVFIESHLCLEEKLALDVSGRPLVFGHYSDSPQNRVYSAIFYADDMAP
jgi:hypothetical protein